MKEDQFFSANKFSLLIHETDFKNNTAGLCGGAISIFNQSFIAINESSLISNSMLGDVSKGGGFFAQLNCTLIISHVHLTGCFAAEAGALYGKLFSQIIIFNSSFEANRDLMIALVGSVSTHISECKIFNNSKPLGIFSSGPVNVTNTIFSCNFGQDGAIFYVDTPFYVLFSNCSFTENTAFEGGAIYGANSNTGLIGSNFTKNNATNGGVFAVTGLLLIKSSILNNNTAKGGSRVEYLETNNQLNITRSFFRRNSAHNDGGVLWIKRAPSEYVIHPLYKIKLNPLVELIVQNTTVK